jgi:hypothetical protein
MTDRQLEAQASGVVDADAETAIRNVIGELGQASDSGDMDLFLASFTEDGIVESGPSLRQGHESLAERFRQGVASGATGAGSGTRHVVIPFSFRRVGPDRVVARSNWIYFRHAGSEPPELALTGQYEDHFVHGPTGWKIARRINTFG